MFSNREVAWLGSFLLRKERKGTERTEPVSRPSTDRRQDNAADYTTLSPLASMGVQVTLVDDGERRLNRPRLGLKSANGIAQTWFCRRRIFHYSRICGRSPGLPLILFHPKCGRFRPSRPTSTRAKMKPKSASGREAV